MTETVQLIDWDEAAANDFAVAEEVTIITDRDELDKQIEDVFSQAGETIHRDAPEQCLLSSPRRPDPSKRHPRRP